MRSRRAAQRLLDYLGEPSPIDAWKAKIGTGEGQLRLKHLLAAVGEQRGLTYMRYPSTMLAVGGEDPAEIARALVDNALRVEGERRQAADEVQA